MPRAVASSLPPDDRRNHPLLPDVAHLPIILSDSAKQMRYPPLLLSLLVIAGASLGAQEGHPTDVLTGRVTDLGGRPVAEAQIEAASLTSNLTRTQLTDSAGRYRIAFPENANRYRVTARRMGFSPVQRTIQRGSTHDELFVADMQFIGAPVALSMVEVTGDTYRALQRDVVDAGSVEVTVPNPVAEILSRKDSLHLSAVQIVALSDLADSLHAKNSALFLRIQKLIARQREDGDATQMAGTVSLMLQEASVNSDRSLQEAEKLLRPEQWASIPKGITARLEMGGSPTP